MLRFISHARSAGQGCKVRGMIKHAHVLVLELLALLACEAQEDKQVYLRGQIAW